MDLLLFLQMNTLDSLLHVCRLVETPGEPLLSAHQARTYTYLIDGQTLGDLGCEPILHMRHFQVLHFTGWNASIGYNRM